MEKNLSTAVTDCPDFERKEVLNKNYYFDNERVERLMYEYLAGACIDVNLRDEIMEHASELIRQLIKAHNLNQICPGKDGAVNGDLFQTAWLQIESSLYKYEARPHCSVCYNSLRPSDSLLVDDFWFVDRVIKRIKRCPRCKSKLVRDTIYYRGKSKVFNFWSQVGRTVVLAYIKKENRDHKNSGMFQTHLENKTIKKSEMLERFTEEARDIFRYNDDYNIILDAIKQLYNEDDKPYDGLISKLVTKTNLSRPTITEFLRTLRLRSKDFTDSPVNEENENLKIRIQVEFEEFD